MSPESQFSGTCGYNTLFKFPANPKGFGPEVHVPEKNKKENIP
jgi:hypothetical protein